MTIKSAAPRRSGMVLTLGCLGWSVWCGADTDVAWSRQWKPTPVIEARDYTTITDTRQQGDVRMIIWLASPLLAVGKSQQLLRDYVVIGVVHAHMSPGGTVSFDKIDTLQANDGNARPLRLLTGDDIPPVINGAVTTVEGVFSQSMGAFGKGTHGFVFAAGSVDACKDGGLAIPFADEIYTYQTPIPGCATYKHPDGTSSPAPSHAALAAPPTTG